MHSPDRSLTLSPDARTLWVHWGRTGGGPRFLADLVDGDLASGGPSHRTALSYNPDAEIAARLAGTDVPSFPVPTYNSTVGVILGVPRLLWNSVRLRRWIREQHIERVVCVMESVYQSLALPLLVPRDVEYVACIHDATLHPGEENILQVLGKRNELRRADRVVTFSDAVTRALSGRVDVPVTTGSHPPFDLQDAATVPRTLPTDPAVPVVGIFGRLQRYKGIDVALEAARILRGRGDGAVPDFELRIIGSGPEERLRDTDLGAEAVWDNRWIPEDEVTDVVRGIDIMLLPYTEASQSGPVTLALAHAVPCVATPVGAIPDQVTGFGVVADDVSPRAVADALESLLTDPDRYRELSAGAVRRVAEQPDWSDLAELIRGKESGEASSSAAGTGSSAGTTPVTRIKWAGQRFFGALNSIVPLRAATETEARVRVVLPASHGSFGDEAMGLVAANRLREAGREVDLVVPGEPGPWRSIVPEGVGVVGLGSVTVGPGNTPTSRTVDRIADGPLVVIGADTLAGDYELALLATRVRLLNLAAAAGHPAALVNFSLPSTVHPDARRILRRLDEVVQVRARDKASAQRAEEILGRDVPTSPDIAALLEPSAPADPGFTGHMVAFVPNAHLGGMYGVSTDQLVSLWRDVARLLVDRDPGLSVDVVVHDIRDSVGDIDLGRKIVDALTHEGIRTSLVVPESAAAAKAVLARAQVCVSARMHAGVAALSSGVPTVGIGYVGKFSGQFAWYGRLGEVVEYRPDLSAGEIAGAVSAVSACGAEADARTDVADLIRAGYPLPAGSGPDRA